MKEIAQLFLSLTLIGCMTMFWVFGYYLLIDKEFKEQLNLFIIWFDKVLIKDTEVRKIYEDYKIQKKKKK